MATSHGSPPMERNSKLDCKCSEKGGPDRRQPWGRPSKQRISKREAKWPGNASWQEEQWATAKETKASKRQRQTDAIKTLAIAKRGN